MAAYQFRMPAGIPGNVTRAEQSTIEGQTYDPSLPFPAYGVPMKTGSNGKMQPIAAGDTGNLVAGLLVRPYPTTGTPGSAFAPTLGAAVPPTSGICNRLRRGYMMVQLNGTAAAAKDALAYIRVGNASTGKVIGGIEAAADISVTGTPGANTGNGTIGTLSAASATPAATYIAKFTSATAFNVTDVSGAILGAGVVGTQLTLDNGLSFKIVAGGTAFVANDTFSIVVVMNTIVSALSMVFTGPADATGNTEVAFNI